MESGEGGRGLSVEGIGSVFITAGRIYRLNSGCVTESGPLSRQEINVVVVFVHAGNYRLFSGR